MKKIYINCGINSQKIAEFLQMFYAQSVIIDCSSESFYDFPSKKGITLFFLSAEQIDKKIQDPLFFKKHFGTTDSKIIAVATTVQQAYASSTKSTLLDLVYLEQNLTRYKSYAAIPQRQKDALHGLLCD